jgi:hypothetical protein
MWHVETFTKLLQLSMLPVVLISAAGLLLLSITNRLGRTIDRSREIARELSTGTSPLTEAGREQLRVLVRRAGLLRACATCVALSILFSSVMMIGLFLLVFESWTAQAFVLTMFFLSVLSLILSLTYFLADISVALKALRLDVAEYIK